MIRIVDHSLIFDDVLLLPDQSGILLKDIDLKTRLTQNLNLDIPLLSAAMDAGAQSCLGIDVSMTLIDRGKA